MAKKRYVSYNIPKKKIKKNFKRAALAFVNFCNSFIMHAAKEHLVPEDTGVLRKSIFERVIKKSDSVTGIVGSDKEYARMQHDFVLHHWGQPKGKSMSDRGDGRTRKAKYWDGYEKLMKASALKQYAANYLVIPQKHIERNIEDIFERYMMRFF